MLLYKSAKRRLVVASSSVRFKEPIKTTSKKSNNVRVNKIFTLKGFTMKKIVEKKVVMGVKVTNTYYVNDDVNEFVNVASVCSQYDYLNLQYLEKISIGRQTKPIEMFDYKIEDKWYRANSKVLQHIVDVINGQIKNIMTDGFYKLVTDSNVNNTTKDITLSKDFQKYRIQHVAFDVETMTLEEVTPKKSNKASKTDEEKFIAYVEKSGFCKAKILELLEKCEFNK